jgi:hypothetical protein
MIIHDLSPKMKGCPSKYIPRRHRLAMQGIKKRAYYYTPPAAACRRAWCQPRPIETANPREEEDQLLVVRSA